jgi:thiamine biosynthesis lipoprotein
LPWNRPLILTLLAFLLVAAWWHWQPADDEVRRTRFLMGTTVEILVAGHSRADLEAAVEAAMAEMNRLEKLFGNAYPESDPSHINRSEAEHRVAPETAEVLAVGLQVAELSRGAFDLGLGRLKALWDIEGANPRVPSAEKIAAAVKTLGPGDVALTGQVVTKRDGVDLDLSGVAKGYIVDRAVGVLRQHGITQAAVNAGGDMYLLGHHGARPWRIGIQHPRNSTEILAKLTLSDQAVVTSGDYERFFVQDGRRYHHLFNPKTGYPATACQSVTVVAGNVALADALATALFVLGPEDGLALLQAYPGSEALIIDAAGMQHASAGLAAYLAGS